VPDLRRLRADVFIDSVVSVTGIPRDFPGFPAETPRHRLLPTEQVAAPKVLTSVKTSSNAWAAASRGSVSSTECKTAPTISQALHFSVGDTIQPRLAAGGKLKAMVDSKEKPEEVINELFILALARRPTTNAGGRAAAACQPHARISTALRRHFLGVAQLYGVHVQSLRAWRERSRYPNRCSRKQRQCLWRSLLRELRFERRRRRRWNGDDR